MFSNYFKTAWRNLIRNKVYSGLNIVGLAIGMAVALLIGLWVVDQSSYDRGLPGYQQAYQVRFNYKNNGETLTQTEVCLPLEEALKKDIPEIAYAAPSFGPTQNVVTAGDKRLNPKGLTVGPEFLKIFQFPLLAGSAEDGLKDPGSIMLTESTAKALFGKTDPIGKLVGFNTDDTRKVTGILKDLPTHSSLQFEFLISFKAFEAGGWVKAARTNWNDCYFTMYASLKPNTTPAHAMAASKMLVQKYAPDSYKTFQRQVNLQPMKDWHLYTSFRNGVASGGLIDYIRMFSIIGILVLLIACINFMNLSTARSEKRAREVGVRKVMGSSRKGLITQFLVESVVTTFLAFLLALSFVQLALPAFNALTKASAAIPWSNTNFWLIMISYVLLTGLLAGSRPAFYLSSFQPVKVLKGAMGRTAMNYGGAASSRSFLVRNLRFPRLSRKILVVLQFTCSIALIISTIIVYQQIQYAKNRSTGYDPNRLLLTSAGYTDYQGLRHELLQAGIVSSITRSLSPPTEVYSHNTISDWQGRLPNEPLVLAMNAVADTDYFKTLGIPMVSGKNFTGNASVDSFCVILNESAVRHMRFKEPLNQTITWLSANSPNHLRVIGVVKDALTHSPFSQAEPTFFLYQPDWTFNFTYRLSPNIRTEAALARLKPIFEKYNRVLPYEYHFADEAYAAKFDMEMLIGKLSGIFSALAVFISCLGLFGLAAYVAEQRSKEIGIRKVLGASVSQMVILLTRDFLLLVIISCLIASPVAYYFLHVWLQGYYYRISIGPGVFILSALMAIVITILTIGFQAIRTALMNPVKSLHTE